MLLLKLKLLVFVLFSLDTDNYEVESYEIFMLIKDLMFNSARNFMLPINLLYD